MMCATPGCFEEAYYRHTVENVVLLLCLRDMEILLDHGAEEEEFWSLPGPTSRDPAVQ